MLNLSMKKAFSIVSVMTSSWILLACGSVPQVEDRLQSMQFYPNMYVVQAGETMESVAHRYQLTKADLEALNPGLSNNFSVGQRINVRPGTMLSGDVRQRARTTYSVAQQPAIVNENQSRQISAQQIEQQRHIAINNQVVTQPIPIQPQNVQRSTAPAPVESVIKEIPASARSSNRIVVADGTFTEEVIPDTLDYNPVQANRDAMNTELAQYVGDWAWPTDGQVAREFAPNEAGGQGVDIAGLPGQDVRAAMAGTVVYSGRDLSGGGNLIIVRHNDSLMTTYSHADQLFVAEDDQVVAGDPIASLGWNADKVSVLRFEVRENGNPLDPMKFLPLQ